MLVPDIVVSPLSLENDADVMYDPGAKVNIQLPTLEKDASVSSLFEAPTVIADGAEAGLDAGRGSVRSVSDVV